MGYQAISGAWRNAVIAFNYRECSCNYCRIARWNKKLFVCNNCNLSLHCMVMYDAFGVRLEAGRQAEVLNQIVYELPAEHPLAESRSLLEILGHTQPQLIVGALLGILTSSVVRLIFLISS